MRPSLSRNKLYMSLSNSKIAQKFKILTCCSTSCSRKRESLGQSEFATYAMLWGRSQQSKVTIQESPCLGGCQKAPCVAIEHEDYEGTVSLEGMRPDEFEKRVFYDVTSEEDGDRVWSCVENAIQVLHRQENDPEAALTGH